MVVGLCFPVLDVSVCESFAYGEDRGWELVKKKCSVKLRAKFLHIRVSRWAPEPQGGASKVMVGPSPFYEVVLFVTRGVDEYVFDVLGLRGV